MTIVGKILAALNLIFSLVVGVLIIQVFATRTNWENAYKQLRQRYDVAEANSRQYSVETQEAKAERQQEIKDAQRTAADWQAKYNEEKRGRDSQTAENQEIKKKIDAAEVNIRAVTEEQNRRKVEIDNLRAVTADKDKRMVELEKANKEFRDQAVAAEIAAKTEHAYNLRLLDQLASVTKELEKRQSSFASTPGAGARKPPLDDVEGYITSIDTKSGLVTLNIGSDSGLTKGNTLEVYRLKPTPKYLGAITILDTQFREAVARPMPPLRVDQIMEKDIVASRIMASKR
jgi:hypothetical protein